MSITFSDAPPLPLTDCGICYDPLEEGVVGHDNMHFLHRKCIAAWFKYQNSCPYCRKLVYDSGNDDELAVYIASLVGMGGPFLARIICLANEGRTCPINENCLQRTDIQTAAMVTALGGVMGRAMGKLICKLWVPKSERSAQIRNFSAAAISLIAPCFITYQTAQYYGRC
jgi:hypothetical protein